MISSQQRLALRLARRRLPNRLVHYQQQQQRSQPLASLSSRNWFHSSSSSQRSDDDQQQQRLAMQLRGLPLVTTSWNSNYQTNVSFNQRMSFSTTTQKEEEKKSTYSETAAHYTDQAKHGAKSFGGMMQTYGPTFLYTYLGVYVLTLGGLYLGVESGVLDPVTLLGYITGNPDQAAGNTAEVVAEVLKHYTITEPFADTVKEKPHLANFAVAWVSTKFTEPVRLGASAAIVPRVARYMGVVPNQNSNQKDDGEAEKAATEESVTKDSGKNADADTDAATTTTTKEDLSQPQNDDDDKPKEEKP